jgi:thiol-disulfide isomerase/thioredoxin
MKLFKQWLTAAILLLCLPSFAQHPTKKLKIGDTVPDLVLNNIINYKSSTAKLSDFKGKAIILDLWNKYCGSCIDAFPKMQQLQADFKDDLVVLLVNDDVKQTRENLESLFKKSTIVENTSLPMVLSNEIFEPRSELFPHSATPYHIWMDKDRVIRALTNGLQTSSEDIKDLIAGKNPDVQIRVDFEDYDQDDLKKSKSLLEVQNGELRKYLVYYKKVRPLSGYADQVSVYAPGEQIFNSSYPYHTCLFRNPLFDLGNSGNYRYIPEIDNARTFFLNSSIFLLYMRAYGTFCKVIVDSENADQYYPPKNPSSKETVEWQRNSEFIYEAILPQGLDESEYSKIMREDLESYFGFTAQTEIRRMKCIVFYRNGQELKLPMTKGGAMVSEDTESDKGYIWKNAPAIQRIIDDISRRSQSKDDPVVLNETGINHRYSRLDMTIYSNLDDIPALSKELSKYGIAIKEEIRNMPVLVLRKGKQ